MKNTVQKSTPNFFSQNKDLIIASSTILLLATAGYTWYYFKKKKENTLSSEKTQAQLIPSKAANFPMIATSKKGSESALKERSTIKYGSRSAAVKILQRYLKIYKEDLGNSGVKSDGVDGIFGPKTASAAKKRLGKAVFNQSDIDGMERTLKTMGK